MQDATQKHVCVELNKWAGGSANFIILLCESPNSVFQLLICNKKFYILFLQDPDERRDDAYDTLYSVLAENEQLRDKIEGLNEEYAKIGLEVFNAFSDDVFTGIEKLIAIRHEIKANESAMADSGWG